DRERLAHTRHRDAVPAAEVSEGARLRGKRTQEQREDGIVEGERHRRAHGHCGDAEEEAAPQLLEMLDQGHRGSRSVAGASDGAGGGTSFIDFLNSLSALPSALPISGRRRGPKIKSAIIPTMNNSGQWNPMVLLLRLLVGVAARVRAGQPAAQARILGKLGPQPLEYGTGFGLAPEGVERVGREPAAAEAQPWLVRCRPEPFEEREQAKPGGHERHRPDDWAPARGERQKLEPPDEKSDVPCPLPPLLVRTHYGSNTGRGLDCYVRVLARLRSDQRRGRGEQDQRHRGRPRERASARERQPAEKDAARDQADREVDDDRMVKAEVGHQSNQRSRHSAPRPARGGRHRYARPGA